MACKEREIHQQFQCVEVYAVFDKCCTPVHFVLPMKRHPHRGIIVAGHPTSLRLEAEFWDFLREIAYERQLSLSELINAISQAKSRKVTLASALRVFVAQHYRAAASQRC